MVKATCCSKHCERNKPHVLDGDVVKLQPFCRFISIKSETPRGFKDTDLVVASLWIIFTRHNRLLAKKLNWFKGELVTKLLCDFENILELLF